MTISWFATELKISQCQARMDFQHKFNEVTLMFSTRYLNECESFGRELFYDSMNSVAKDENSYEYS